MENEKRKVRAYKMKDSDYNRAMRMAKRIKAPLSHVVEAFVTQFGHTGNLNANIKKVKK